jgi:hypothetical protein
MMVGFTDADYSVPSNPLARGAGLGAVTDLPKNAAGYTLDCTNLAQWTLTPQCWPNSPTAWQQIRDFNNPFSASDIVPPAAVPLAYTNQPTYPGDSGQVMTQYVNETDQVIADAAAQTQANVLAAVQTQGNEVPNPTTNYGLWLGVAAAVTAGVLLLTRR